MNTRKPGSAADDRKKRDDSATAAHPTARPEAEPGTNAVEHQPDPDAQPIPDGEHKYIRRSPYTAGND